MKVAKRLFGTLGMVLLTLAAAACITWVAADDASKAEVEESVRGAFDDPDEERLEPIDWDSLPQEVVAWVEVPGTNISQPIAKADKGNPDAYLYLDALGRGGYGTPYIDADCTEESLLVPVYGHNMSGGSVFADFAKYSDESFARAHSKINLHSRSGQSCELSVVAVDVVDASCETMCPSFDDAEAISKQIAKSDVVFREYGGASQMFAFTTCSYQTANSRTVVYASLN